MEDLWNLDIASLVQSKIVNHAQQTGQAASNVEQATLLNRWEPFAAKTVQLLIALVVMIRAPHFVFNVNLIFFYHPFKEDAQ